MDENLHNLVTFSVPNQVHWLALSQTSGASARHKNENYLRLFIQSFVARKISQSAFHQGSSRLNVFKKSIKKNCLKTSGLPTMLGIFSLFNRTGASNVPISRVHQTVNLQCRLEEVIRHVEQRGIDVKTSCAKRLHHTRILMEWLHIKGETSVDIVGIRCR